MASSSATPQVETPKGAIAVGACSRRYAALTEELATSRSIAPDADFIDPSGRHVAVRSRNVVDLINVGESVMRDFAWSNQNISLAWMDRRSFLFNEGEYFWDGKPGHAVRSFALGIDIHGEQLAARLVDDLWTSVAQEAKSLQQRASVSVACEKRTSLKWRPGDPLWGARLVGFGTGAIAKDGRVAVAMVDGHFVVLSRDGDPSHPGEAVRLVDETLPEESYFVSAADPGFVVLGAVDTRGPAHRDWERDIRGLRAREFAFATRWSTRVRMLDAQGKTTWTADVPFEARQPPLDGGRGRIYVVGEGIAAIDSGTIAWSTPGPRAMASAFSDQCLAVAVGSALRIVGPDGAVQQQLNTPDAEGITATPTIAADGTVWIATGKHVYAVR